MTRALALVLCISALRAPAQEPAAGPPTFAFVGLHGGVFAQLQQHAAALPVRVEYLDDERIARREGSLTYKTAPDLTLRLGDVVRQHVTDGCRHLVLDFSRIHLIDSSGVTLVSAMRNLVAAHGTLQLCALRPHVVKIFELLKLTAAAAHPRIARRRSGGDRRGAARRGVIRP